MPLTTSRVLETNKKKRHVEFNRDLPLKTLTSTSCSQGCGDLPQTHQTARIQAHQTEEKHTRSHPGGQGDNYLRAGVKLTMVQPLLNFGGCQTPGTTGTEALGLTRDAELQTFR